MSESESKGWLPLVNTYFLILSHIPWSLIIVKCDGSRPRCGVCVSKNRECLFRGEEGQSWEAILKSRVESLEQRVHELQAGQTSRAQPAEPKESGPYNILVVLVKMLMLNICNTQCWDIAYTSGI